ncbi:septal ring lytic transglycosylase RlpA family protein [Adhaeribacter radiodurans]|uniref:Probable endolytic peptidoglycan transglycosylase RlpA n=1 Tax=Adhaeribacter radiodurans TaxID=2745197 RepID=A0A7L7LF36_9BACT|nr:septal ring lytic transglycosylase RlpA family protein [Adhaeribacter radiodurans]QMU30989.1 septal ring lytic transglycosylase RlpA family protein [Adhaeribacter radiodurans]
MVRGYYGTLRRAPLAAYFQILFWALILIGLLSGCASSTGTWKGYTEKGNASFYSDKFQGKKMANGQPYRKGKLTAAHKKIPLGSRVKVTNLKTHRSVKVKITDRGPHSRNRSIDLSRAAAKKVGMIQAGVVPVKIKVLKPKKSKAQASSTK